MSPSLVPMLLCRQHELPLRSKEGFEICGTYTAEQACWSVESLRLQQLLDRTHSLNCRPGPRLQNAQRLSAGVNNTMHGSSAPVGLPSLLSLCSSHCHLAMWSQYIFHCMSSNSVGYGAHRSASSNSAQLRLLIRHHDWRFPIQIMCSQVQHQRV